MTTIPFDTLAHVKKLKKAGVPEKQAETHIEVTAEIMKKHIATKQDLKLLKSDLQSTLTLRMGAIVAAGVTIAIALIPIILKVTHLA